MLKALSKTLNPYGGKGMGETFVFIILIIVVIGVVALNIMGIEIDPLLQTIATGLMGFVGYIVGTNNTGTEEVEETKDFTHVAMTLGEYNVYRGWTIPPDENPEEEGWLLQYKTGYETWIPLDML